MRKEESKSFRIEYTSRMRVSSPDTVQMVLVHSYVRIIAESASDASRAFFNSTAGPSAGNVVIIREADKNSKNS